MLFVVPGDPSTRASLVLQHPLPDETFLSLPCSSRGLGTVFSSEIRLVLLGRPRFSYFPVIPFAFIIKVIETLYFWKIQEAAKQENGPCGLWLEPQEGWEEAFCRYLRSVTLPGSLQGVY